LLFSPHLDILTRISSYNGIASNYGLFITHEEPVLLPISRSNYLSEQFFGKITIETRNGKYVPIPSVSPNARIHSYTSDNNRAIEFYRDKPGNYYIMSPSDGISVLGFVTSSDIYYFSGDIPSHLLLEDIPSEEKSPFNPSRRCEEATLFADEAISLQFFKILSTNL